MLTCDDGGLSGHGNVASTSGSLEERLFEDVNSQNQDEQQKQREHLPPPGESRRLAELSSCSHHT